MTINPITEIDDRAIIGRVLRKYGNDIDIIRLIERVEGRECRIQRRNALIREAARQYPSAALSVSARMLSDALLGYWRSAWAVEQDMPVLPEGAFTRHVQLHQILRANGGKPLGWQMIFNICKKCTQY